MVPCYEYMDGLPYVMMSVYLIVIFFGSFFYVNRKMFAREINYVISSYKAIKITGFSTTTTTAATSGIFSKYFSGKDKKDTKEGEEVLTVDTSVGQILRTENEESKEEGIEFKEESKPEEEKEKEKEKENEVLAAADIILEVRANEEYEEEQK